MIRFAKGLAAGEEAATMVEYALMITLIAAALIAALANLRNGISTFYTSFSGRVSAS